LWLIGFAYFSVTLPQPMGDEQTDAIIVLTGGQGRIERGIELLEGGQAARLLITGVDPEVKPGEFVAQFEVGEGLFDCCITLGYDAVDTRGNAVEASQWIERREVRSVRLVTTDWHMRRAAFELDSKLPPSVTILRDAVASKPSLGALFLEYHKLIYIWIASLWR